MFRRINTFKLPANGLNLFDIADDFFGKSFFETVPALQEITQKSNFAANIWKKDDVFHLRAELPGLKKDSISIEVKGKELKIEAEKESFYPEEATYLLKERSSGKIEQMFTFTHDINQEKVQATYKDGILLITMPVAETAKARKIQITS